MIDLEKNIAEYLKFCEYQKKLDAKSIKAYRIDYMQLIAFIDMQKRAPLKIILNDFIIELHKQYKPKTVKRKIASIKAFFSYLVFENILNENPFSKMKTSFREPFLLPKILPLKTINAIIRAAYNAIANANTEYQEQRTIRDIAVIELLFATGVRVSELCNLKVEDVNLFEGYIKILGKGAKERVIQLGNSEVLASLHKYAQLFSDKISDCGYFFVNRLNKQLSDQSARSIIKKYADICDIGMKVTPHMFRHSFATLLLEEDVDIRYIQKILGHSSITTTQIYTHVTSQKQKYILTSKHPRNHIKINNG